MTAPTQSVGRSRSAGSRLEPAVAIDYCSPGNPANGHLLVDAHRTLSAGPRPGSGLDREFSACARRRRISACTSFRTLNSKMQTLFNTEWLPAETEHRRGQALAVH
jgi:hypothetical protein